jgi:CheY-like chemotaxis protein
VTDFAAIEHVAQATADRVRTVAREEFKELLSEVESRLGGKIDELKSAVGDLRSQVTTLQLRHGPRVIAVGPNDKQARVLVVDDNVPLLHAFRAQLENSGLEVLSTDTVSEAARYLQDDPAVEVAIVDIAMPKNGHTLLEHVRQNHPGVEVIMTSGIDLDPDRARRAGAFGFLPKPFELTQAVLMIEKAAEHRRLKLAAGLRG